MNEHIVEITMDNAQAMLIDESMQRPVVVDFWADWCEPCKQLMPILEKLAAEYAGQFLLAKVNADDMQVIAQQFGVRSLPTVMVIVNGQPVDGFAGAQPESAVREILDKHLPKPWDTQQQEAMGLIEVGDFTAAAALLKLAYKDSDQRADIALLYAQCLLELNQTDDAEAVLSQIAMVDQDAFYQRLLSQLELKREAADSPEIQSLQQQYDANPGDHDIAHSLAIALNEAGRQGEALALLYGILQKDREHRDGDTRKTLLDILKALGPGHPVATEYQRKLYSLLY